MLQMLLHTKEVQDHVIKLSVGSIGEEASVGNSLSSALAHCGLWTYTKDGNKAAVSIPVSDRLARNYFQQHQRRCSGVQ